MEENMVITLENGQRFLLLLENGFTEGKYFLAVRLEKNDAPSTQYVVFEEKDGGEATEIVTDPILLNKLISDYQEQYENMGETGN